MILKQPYAFRGLKWLDLKDIFNGINRYIITDYSYLKDRQLVNVSPFEGDTTLNPVILYGQTSSEKEIPIFNHPLVNEQNRWIALDLRQVATFDKEHSAVRIRNDGEYQMLVRRYVLSGMWAVGKQPAVYGLKFPHLVYGEFIASTLAKKFGLHMGDQIRLKALACLFYTSLFTEAALTDEDLGKLRVRMKEELIPEDLLDEVFLQKELMTTLDGFGEACFNVTNNVRLKNLDYNVLVSIFSMTWFGLNAKETILLALEHPPTWVALVFACLTNRSFKNSALAKTVEQKDRRNAGSDFLTDLVHQVNQYKQD